MGQRLALVLAGLLTLSSCGNPTAAPMAAPISRTTQPKVLSLSAARGTFRTHGFVVPANPFVLGQSLPAISGATARLGPPCAAGFGNPYGGLGRCGLPGTAADSGPFFGGYSGFGYGMIGYGGLGFHLPTIGLGYGIGTTTAQPRIQLPAPSQAPSDSDRMPHEAPNDQTKGESTDRPEPQPGSGS